MMHYRTLFSAVVAAVLIGLSLPASVGAQQRNGRQPVPRSLYGGLYGASLLSATGNISDPTHTNAFGLLMQRKDVQNELALDDQQLAALREIPRKMMADVRAKMLGGRSAVGVDPVQPNYSPEERRAEILKRQEQQREALAGYMEDLSKRADDLLRPNQVRRLHELDLQWRGPLALTDPKVADKLDLTPEQRTKVSEALEDYYAARQKVMLKFNGSVQKSSSPGDNAPNAKPTPPSALNEQDMRARMADAQKDIEQARKAAGEKALAVLTSDQRERWKTLLGQPFTFRELE